MSGGKLPLLRLRGRDARPEKEEQRPEMDANERKWNGISSRLAFISVYFR